MAASAEKKDGIWETIKTIFWALVIAGVFRTVFYQPFWIPSSSMKDTLLIGDFLFVNKMVYGYSRYSCPFAICPISGRILGSAPERGDVVVFRHPVSGEDFIKRLIGLPGDTVQMIDGVLQINGAPVAIEPAGTFSEIYERQGPLGQFPSCEGGRPEPGEACTATRARETLPGGRVHNILNIGDSFADDTGIFTVPLGHYFFMGDNRDNSLDSRVPQSASGVGFVSEEYLIGRAERVIFSSAGRRLFYLWTWRADRFFKRIE